MSFLFNFQKNYDVLKSKSPCILLNKNVNFNWNETKSKIQNPRETNRVFQSSYKNRKLKVKLWWAGARKRKKKAFFVPFILFKGKHLCFISMHGVLNTFWEYALTRIYTLKTLLHTLFCLLRTFCALLM